MERLQKGTKVLLVLAGLFTMVSSCSGNPAIEAIVTAEEEGDKDRGDLSGWGKSLGVNYNEQLKFIDFNNLEKTNTEWVRGFVDFFQLFDKPGALHSDKKILNYLSLKEHGYRTILNIKWNFKGRGEKLPNDDREVMEAYLNFLEDLLEKVWYHTDIIVIGNEPFIETLANEKDQRLVDFYIIVARAVERFRDLHPDWYVPIFVGAFNNLYDPLWRTEAVDSLMEFVQSDPGISGIDLHIHHAEMQQMKDALHYASCKIRDDQKILITEFSLMKHWKAQLTNNINESFAIQYQLRAEMKNYQYIDFALKNPRTANEWFDFLQNSTWFESRKHYLKEAFSLMTNDPKFLVASYAIRQSYPIGQDFTSTTDPWVLNGLFANRTIRQDAGTGQDQLNYSFIDDFISIQNYRK